MSNSKRDNGPIVVGGEPRIDFLPTETKMRKENRRRRRSFVALIIMVAIVCGIGVYSSYLFAQASEASLKTAQDRTSELLAEQGQFVKVRTAQSALATAEDARLVASATEVFWEPYMAKVRSDLPSGTSFISFTIDGVSPLESSPIPELLLEEPRLITITFSIASPNVALADAVLISLQGQPFNADSIVSDVTWDREAQVYVVTATLHLTAEALEKRFFPDASTETEG